MPNRYVTVEQVMVAESAAAIIRFTNINPHWRGAHWADALDTLCDCDSDLEVVEPMWDSVREVVGPDKAIWIGLVTRTLLWAGEGADPNVVITWCDTLAADSGIGVDDYDTIDPPAEAESMQGWEDDDG